MPWAAAFSAFGNACAQYKHRYQKSLLVGVPQGIPAEAKVEAGQAINDAYCELEEKAYTEFENEGFDRKKVNIMYGANMRFMGQLYSFEAYPLPVSRIVTEKDMDSIIDTFEKVYGLMYPVGARFSEVGYFFTEVFIEATADKPVPKIAQYNLKGKEPPAKALKNKRDVFHKGKWTKFNIWEMDLLEAGNRIDGPATIEHPMTTIVIPPGKYMEFDQFKVLWYKNQ